MGQCVSCFAGLQWQHCNDSEREGGAVSNQPAPCVSPEQSLREGLAAFCGSGVEKIRFVTAERASRASDFEEDWEQRWLRWNEETEMAEAMWLAAYDIVEAILLGVVNHVPGVISRAEFEEGSENAVASLKVQLSCAEVYGEFATRSRMGAQIRLEQEVCFALQCIPEDLASEPITVKVRGLDFPALPGTLQLRQEIVKSLGSDFSKATAFAEWETRKDDFPPERSKLRRVHESLAQYYLPSYVFEKAFWGYLNAPPCGHSYMETFEIHQEGESGVRVTSRRRPPSSDVEREQVAIIDDLCLEVLLKDRFLGEQFAPSSMNFLAMTHGRVAGQQGADPKKIVKLFTAAKHWGPGDKGWQRFDETWLCTDQKDWLGRTLEEQGRVLWRQPGSTLS